MSIQKEKQKQKQSEILKPGWREQYQPKNKEVCLSQSVSTFPVLMYIEKSDSEEALISSP